MTRQSIEALCKEIKARIAAGETAEKKSKDHLQSAGLQLLTLKERAPDEWLDHAKKYIGIGKTRAYELLAIADGRTTVDETRARTKKRTARSRTHSSSPLRSGKNGEQGNHDDSADREEAEALYMTLLIQVGKFVPRVLKRTRRRALSSRARDNLISAIESMSESLQELADTIRTEGAAAAANALGSRRFFRHAPRG